jgi:hypothetical protein
VTETEIRADERARCAQQMRDFATFYVQKWEQMGVDSKAEGWAILQAAQDLSTAESKATR